MRESHKQFHPWVRRQHIANASDLVAGHNRTMCSMSLRGLQPKPAHKSASSRGFPRMRIARAAGQDRGSGRHIGPFARNCWTIWLIRLEATCPKPLCLRITQQNRGLFPLFSFHFSRPLTPMPSRGKQGFWDLPEWDLSDLLPPPRMHRNSTRSDCWNRLAPVSPPITRARLATA